AIVRGQFVPPTPKEKAPGDKPGAHDAKPRWRGPTDTLRSQDPVALRHEAGRLRVGELGSPLLQGAEASRYTHECQRDETCAGSGAGVTSRSTTPFPSCTGVAIATRGSCSKIRRQPPAVASANKARLLSSVRSGSRSYPMIQG